MKNKSILNILSLVFSFSTLFCCVLPSLFVLLGAGSVFASLTSSLPVISFLGENKDVVFIVSGIVLLVAGVFRYLSRNASCPVDKKLAYLCTKTKKVSFYLYLFSCFLYLISFFFSYILMYFIM